MKKKRYLGKTSSSNSLLPVFESLAKEYGGVFKDFKFDFSNNPEGLHQLRNALGNPKWFDLLVDNEKENE